MKSGGILIVVALLGPVCVSPYVIKVQKFFFYVRNVRKIALFVGKPRYRMEAILHDIKGNNEIKRICPHNPF
jgi:hypothetical protein